LKPHRSSLPYLKNFKVSTFADIITYRTSLQGVYSKVKGLVKVAL
jgi:hypothetical protein